MTPSNMTGIFYDFCDSLEIENGTVAPSEGWGVEHTLKAWGAYDGQPSLERSNSKGIRLSSPFLQILTLISVSDSSLLR